MNTIVTIAENKSPDKMKLKEIMFYMVRKYNWNKAVHAQFRIHDTVPNESSILFDKSLKNINVLHHIKPPVFS